MGLNPSTLKDWSDVDNSLTIKAIEKNRLQNIKGLRQLSNVVGSIEVPFLYSAPSFTNIACNTTSSGVTSLGSTSVSTCLISYRELICTADLQGKQFTKYITDLNESLPFEREMADEAAMHIEKNVEKQFFQGHPSVAVDGVLCTGLYYLLDQNTGLTINATYSAITNVGQVDYICSLIPDVVRDMPVVTMTMKPSDFQGAKTAFRNANLVQYSDQDANPDIFKIPGYDNIYISKHANAGSRIVVTYGENLIQANNIGSGLELFYDKYEKKYVKDATYRLGAGVHFYAHVVHLK